MSKKASSLATALQPFDRKPPTPPAAPVTGALRIEKDAARPASAQAPSRIGKKPVIAYLSYEAAKQLKQLAVTTDQTVQALIIEGVNEVFQKHNKPTIA
jgi:hypothetical protein